MARGTDTDFATTLGMLHTAVTNTGNDLRDALGKSVEKLEASGQAAQQETSRSVVEELGRMRTNLREARDRLSAGGEMLNAEVRQAVAGLRAEIRDVRASLEQLTPLSGTEAGIPAYAPGPEVSGVLTAASERAPVATATVHGELPGDPDRGAIPAQRDGHDSEPPGDARLPVDLIQQAVRDVLAEELAPLSAFLAEKQNSQRDEATALRDDVRAHLREAVQELRGHLEEARQEARAELAALREETIGLRAGLEQLRPQPDEKSVVPEVSTEHSKLLKEAARVSSADLLCHRDVWEFITAQAGRHPHFRVPAQVTDEGNERIRVALSGRSLIALLISLHAVGNTARDGDGDLELAGTLYERIRARLARLTPQGQPVTITLDDRSFPSDDVPPTDGTAPASTEGPGASTPASNGDDHRDQKGSSDDGSSC
ncbi:hypothetical protein AB0P17_42250 [Streptomyces sp. NPDC088124]|uniref:hypothetical protein n=1 Tax=Streptomyces sp. NPDC088124 TaxID=3154654 RepID=UPI003412BA05